MVSQKKQDKVDSLTKLLTENPHFALVRFGSVSHASLESLRSELKKNESKLKVVKASLLEKAINKLSVKSKQIKELQKGALPFKEEVAILTLGRDYVKGLSAFAQFAKKETTLSFRFGLLDDRFYLSEQVQKISQLPPYDQLVAKLLSSLQAPSSKLAYSIKFNINKFVYILQQKAKQS